MSSRLAKLFWIACDKSGMTLISLVTFFVYAKLLEPAEFGLAILALSVGQGLSLVFCNLFEDPLVRHESPSRTHFDSALWGGSLFSLLLAAIAAGIVFLLALPEELRELLLLSLLLLPLLSVSSVFVAELRRKGAFRQLAKRTIVARLIGGAVGIALAFGGAGSWAMVIQAVVIEVISVMALVVMAAERPGFAVQFKVIAELGSVGWALCLRRLNWDACIRGIPIILGVTAGAAAVGIFGFAWRLVDMPRSAIASGLMSYALPTFARRQSQIGELRALFCKATWGTALIVMPLFIGLAAVAPQLVPWLFGEKWQDAILPVQLLAMMVAVSQVMIFAPTVMTAVKRPTMTLASDTVATLFALIVTVYFGAAYGAVAGAIAMVGRSLFGLPFNARGLQHVLGLAPLGQLTVVAQPLVAAVVMALLISLFNHYIVIAPSVQLPLAILLGGGVYLALISLIKRNWWWQLRTFLD